MFLHPKQRKGETTETKQIYRALSANKQIKANRKLPAKAYRKQATVLTASKFRFLFSGLSIYRHLDVAEIPMFLAAEIWFSSHR